VGHTGDARRLGPNRRCCQRRYRQQSPKVLRQFADAKAFPFHSDLDPVGNFGITLEIGRAPDKLIHCEARFRTLEQNDALFSVR
jgi:hypothetical protein